MALSAPDLREIWTVAFSGTEAPAGPKPKSGQRTNQRVSALHCVAKQRTTLFIVLRPPFDPLSHAHRRYLPPLFHFPTHAQSPVPPLPPPNLRTRPPLSTAASCTASVRTAPAARALRQ
ncbi:hypothetical protein PsYK624_014490 [Phanerochaete sordida]|uniref:Uncharacterized protein n=1 Tax=Phanerochaete sordida TaxID=48140 RepID=A0A9P3FZV6_9APHY|nr:hypothetical protein PsYK624_014490 [Phanerochaete sordida]